MLVGVVIDLVYVFNVISDSFIKVGGSVSVFLVYNRFCMFYYYVILGRFMFW